MVESVLERLDRTEDWYTSEAKEKVLALKARRYLEEPVRRYLDVPCVQPVRRIRYNPQPFPREVIFVTTRNRRKAPDRRQRPPKEVTRRENSPGVISAIQRMLQFLELPPGWNSYNARVIGRENVNVALSLLSRTMRADTPVPNVIPMVRGGVQLEWHTRGINLELSIYSPEEIRFQAEDVRGGETVEGELDLGLLDRWIDRLSG